MSAAIRGVAVVLLLLCAAWLSQACAVSVEVGRDTAANCAGWDDMRRGLVSCETGDRCSYDADGAPAAESSARWSCGCGAGDVNLFWCNECPEPGAVCPFENNEVKCGLTCHAGIWGVVKP